MGAPDPAPTRLPATFRPLWARRVIYPVAFAVLVALGIGAMVLPEQYRLPDRAAICLLAAAVAYFLHRLADVRVRAAADGLTVTNILRSRHLDWAEVVHVNLRESDPWLTLDLADGDTLAAMGVQGSDGAYARRQAAAISALVAEHSRTERDT